MANDDSTKQVASLDSGLENVALTEPDLSAWVMTHMPLILSTDYINDRLHQALIQYAFTDMGWQAFNQWHRGFMEAILHNDLIVKAMVKDGAQFNIQGQKAHADIPVRLMLIGQNPSKKKVVLTRDLKIGVDFVAVQNKIKIDAIKVLAHEQ